MAYLLLLIGLGAWAIVALRDRTVMMHASTFFTCSLIAIPAELATLRFLNSYEWHMRLLADQEADVMVASIIIAWLNPLLGTLYARYCQPRPILKAFLSSIALGLIEILLVNTGFLVYHFWNPILTVVLFLAYFLVVWRISHIVTRIPSWLHLLGFTIWFSLMIDIPLQGICWLWQFQISFFGDTVRDNRLFSAIPNFMILTPCAIAISLAKPQRKLVWAIVAIAVLTLIEAAVVATGFLIYHQWSLGWSSVKYTVVILASIAYKRWIQHGGQQVMAR